MGTNLIEIMPSPKDAQDLLEFYLTRLTPRCGIGRILPLTLDAVFVGLTHCQLALSDKAEPVRKLLIHIHVLPVVVCHSDKPWNHLRLAETNYQLFELINSEDRQAVGDLARYLEATGH